MTTLHFWQEMPATVAEEIAAHEAILEEQKRFFVWADDEKKKRIRREINWRMDKIKKLKGML